MTANNPSFFIARETRVIGIVIANTLFYISKYVHCLLIIKNRVIK